MYPKSYAGYRPADYETAYAAFFNEKMLSLPPHAVKALANSPYSTDKIPPIAQVTDLAKAGYAEVETGYTLATDGSIRVAVLTKMPRVTPPMWDWWFGWHGSHASRYKLWHPKTHLNAQWQDGQNHLLSYVGRNSLIEEYIGNSLEKAKIQFRSPAELGFQTQDFDNKQNVVYVCARLGYPDFPLDFGWLVHQVRATPDGAEMRSRFWIGGEHIALRGDDVLKRSVSKLLQTVVRPPEQKAKDLLCHCAEEMNHLAQFLPELYGRFGV